MPGSRLIRTLSALALLSVLAGPPQPALAAQRTFVATAGSDANPCSRSLPCRTFGAALVQTDSGGEVVALDSGGYGPVTITQPGTIVGAPGAHVAITAFSGAAITVSAGSADKVILRNLYLTGLGGNHGILFTSGATLHVEHVVANGFTAEGIFVFTSTSSETFISDTTVRDNVGGILITAGSGVADASLTRTRAENSAGFGVLAAEGSRVVVSDSIAAGNGTAGFAAVTSTPGTSAHMSIEHSTASGNVNGIGAQSVAGSSSTIDVSNSTITYNSNNGVVAVGAGSSSISSRGNNTLERNGTDGTFTGSITAK